MKHPLTALAGAAFLVALACADTGPGPDPLAPPEAPGTTHLQGTVERDWQPGNCPSPYFTLTTEWAHDLPTAEAADVNGNGNLCIDDINTAAESYLDDQFTCGDNEEAVFLAVEGHPIDEPESDFDPRYDAVLCVNQTSGIAFDDCTGSNETGEIDNPTVPTDPPITIGLDQSAGVGGGCSRPSDFDDVEDARCPEGFGPPFPAAAAGADATDADTNGNGLVCWNGGQYADDVVGLTLTEGQVNGHGTYVVDGSTLSFSFHARSDGEVVRGNFEFHDRGAGTKYHGDVTCLESDGRTVHLEGVIGNGKNSGLAGGTAVAWTAVDNGEGKKSPNDEVSRPESWGELTEPCSTRPSNPVVSIDGGNIQVR